MAYFNSFQIFRIDADGLPIALTDEAINVTEVGGGSLGSVSSDGFGHVATANLAAAAGTVVEFQHPGYLGRFRRTLAATEEEASALLVNLSLGFTVQNLTSTETEALMYEVWARNDDDPDAADVKLGYAPFGETTFFNYETQGPSQHLSLYFNPITATGTHKFSLPTSAPSYEVFVGSSAPGASVTDLGVVPIFDLYEDETTAGTAEETLHEYTAVANLLGATGDKLAAEYAGTFAATADDKRIRLYFDGVAMFDSGTVVENNKHWKLNVVLQRVSNTVARSTAQFSTSIHWDPVYTELTGLLLSTDSNLTLTADDEVAGGTTARTAHGLYIPGVIDYVTYGGEIVSYLGRSVT